MGVHIPLGFGQCAIKFTCVGVVDPIYVTFGYETVYNNLAINGQQLRADKHRDLLQPAAGLLLPTNLATGYKWLGVITQEGHPDGNTTGVSAVASDGIGAASPAPVNCSHLVQKRTNLGGRHGRGRMYFPPIWATEASITADGTVDSTAIATQQTKLNAWLTALTTTDMRMYLLHSDAGIAPTPVTSLTLDPKLATQRRRMR